MPRFGKDYKMYDRIVPSLQIDITNIIENCKHLSNASFLRDFPKPLAYGVIVRLTTDNSG